MKDNTLIWTDLSSYVPEKSKKFYQAVFDINFYDESWYALAFIENTPSFWIYETPEFFKSINMPHFWMSYIQVDNLEETVQKARELWAIIEIEKDEFYGWNIALIRDPLGAGFTIYDGDKLSIPKKSGNPIISNELQVSNISVVKDFYEWIFNWSIKKVDDWTYDVLSQWKWEKITSISEIDNSIKWKYEYWTVIFAVENLEATSKKILKLWWTLISQEENRAMFTDNSGEAFFYIRQL